MSAKAGEVQMYRQSAGYSLQNLISEMLREILKKDHHLICPLQFGWHLLKRLRSIQVKQIDQRKRSNQYFQNSRRTVAEVVIH